jgi:hypothetical protein
MNRCDHLVKSRSHIRTASRPKLTRSCSVLLVLPLTWCLQLLILEDTNHVNAQGEDGGSIATDLADRPSWVSCDVPRPI